jgi:hypothetical protein
LEVLEAELKHLEEGPENERNRFLEQKINQLRVDLLDQETSMNLLSAKHRVPNLRELVCLYFTGIKDKPKREDEAL